MPLYIEKINGDVDRPTDRPTDRQGEYRAICLFRKLENRKKAEICNYFSNEDFDLGSLPAIIATQLLPTPTFSAAHSW